MGIEAGTTLSQLRDDWPLVNDPVHRGDDHLRLIKQVLKAQFPGVAGDGLASPITATEAELNYLSGVTSSIQTQLNALSAGNTALEGKLSAPTGTRMPFYQASPPTGWTQVSINNRFLRVTSGAGGSTGGSEGTSFSKSHKHTINNHALTVAQMPSHSHTIDRGAGNSSGNVYSQAVATTPLSVSVGSGYVNNSGSGQGHNHSMNNATVSWAPSYANIIIAEKD